MLSWDMDPCEDEKDSPTDFRSQVDWMSWVTMGVIVAVVLALAVSVFVR